MAYAICRIAKLKTPGQIGASGGHASRSRNTPNADPSRENVQLIGQSENLVEAVEKRIGEHKPRKNAVLCVDMLVTASPEYFRPDCPEQAGYWEQDKVDAWRKATVEWLTKKYGDQVVSAVLHLDETTPHIQAHIVPMDEQEKLNCKAYFGGREKLRNLQDSYAAALGELGIERGIRNSQAEHVEIRQYYENINQPTPSVKLELPDTTLRDKVDIEGYRRRATESVKQEILPKVEVWADQMADRDRAIQRAKEMERTAQGLAQELEEQKKVLRQLANAMRELPLPTVAYELGLEQDPHDRKKWIGDGHDISITGAKFHDWNPQVLKGGGGAIDLVMQVAQLDYRESVAWLAERFGSEVAVAETKIPRIQAMLNLHQVLDKLLAAQTQNNDLAPLHRELQKHYLDFSWKFGVLNAKENIKALGQDLRYYALRALEIPQGKGWKKVDIFYRRVAQPEVTTVKADTYPGRCPIVLLKPQGARGLGLYLPIIGGRRMSNELVLELIRTDITLWKQEQLIGVQAK